jgi:hypothetical protein
MIYISRLKQQNEKLKKNIYLLQVSIHGALKWNLMYVGLEIKQINSMNLLNFEFSEDFLLKSYDQLKNWRTYNFRWFQK